MSPLTQLTVLVLLLTSALSVSAAPYKQSKEEEAKTRMAMMETILEMMAEMDKNELAFEQSSTVSAREQGPTVMLHGPTAMQQGPTATAREPTSMLRGPTTMQTGPTPTGHWQYGTEQRPTVMTQGPTARTQGPTGPRQYGREQGPTAMKQGPTTMQTGPTPTGLPWQYGREQGQTALSVEAKQQGPPGLSVQQEDQTDQHTPSCPPTPKCQPQLELPIDKEMPLENQLVMVVLHFIQGKIEALKQHLGGSTRESGTDAPPEEDQLADIIQRILSQTPNNKDSQQTDTEKTPLPTTEINAATTQSMMERIMLELQENRIESESQETTSTQPTTQQTTQQHESTEHKATTTDKQLDATTPQPSKKDDQLLQVLLNKLGKLQDTLDKLTQHLVTKAAKEKTDNLEATKDNSKEEKTKDETEKPDETKAEDMTAHRMDLVPTNPTYVPSFTLDAERELVFQAFLANLQQLAEKQAPQPRPPTGK